jgi:tetratricopeptide (TPR) repeat protein
MKHFAIAAVFFLSGCAGIGRNSEAAAKLDALRAHAREGRHEKVIEALSEESIAGLPRRWRPEAYLLLGRSLGLNGELGRSLQIFQLAEGLYPRNLNLITELATALHRTGLDDRAKPHFERVLKIHPNNAVSNQGIAEIYRSQGNLEASQRHFERALAEKGWDKHSGLWKLYGEVLSARRLYDPAAAALEKSVSLSKTPDALIALARVERLRGRDAESRERLAEAILRDPNREDAILQRGLWELEDGDLAAAHATADLVLSGDSNHALARWLRASARLRQGEKEGASADLAVAAAAGRSDPFVAKVAREMLERLIGNP